MDTPVKRAAIACDNCRRRKRRCDGRDPVCSICERSGAECIYSQHDTRRSTHTSAELLDRISNLESLLEVQTAALDSLRGQQIQQHRPITSPTALTQVPSHQDVQADHTSPAFSFDVDAPPMLIPRGHSTTTDSLLASEQVRLLLGRFPTEMFVKQEVRRGWPDEIACARMWSGTETLPDLPRASTEHLVEAYFLHAHIEFPILDQPSFSEIYEHILEMGLQHDMNSALCLAVLAVGSAIVQYTDVDGFSSAEDEPGLSYLSAALQIIIPAQFYEFQPSLTMSQSLLLISKYFNYMLRPLQSWRFIHMASTSIQQSYNLHPTDDLDFNKALSLTAWAIFDTECDLIAEHRLPHSGIEHVMDAMPFPSFNGQHSEATLLFLAEISVRRLLNRVHHTLYDNGSFSSLAVPSVNSPVNDINQKFQPQSVSKVVGISSELDRQLETWFSMLPHAIKPDLQSPDSWTVYGLSLLQRYHSAKDIIFRPFVTYICALPPNNHISSLVLENAEICISNCRSYIYVAAQRLRSTCSYPEIIIHSLLASTIVLTLASLCHHLKHLVVDIDTMQEKSIATIARWARAGSLVEDIVEILQLLRKKAQLLTL